MVAFDSIHNQNGCGLFDSYLKPFTVNKYGEEMHARSLDPNHFMEGYRFVGPKTELILRQKLHDDTPLNDLDSYAKDHDYIFYNEKKEYDKDHDKNKHMNNIWKGDDIFINKAKNSKDDPIMGKIAANLIDKKDILEKKWNY